MAAAIGSLITRSTYASEMQSFRTGCVGMWIQRLDVYFVVIVQAMAAAVGSLKVLCSYN